MYDGQNRTKVLSRERVLTREVNYVGGRIPVNEQSLPAYDPLGDKHNTYLASSNFRNSPFMRLKRAADHAIR